MNASLLSNQPLWEYKFASCMNLAGKDPQRRQRSSGVCLMVISAGGVPPMWKGRRNLVRFGSPADPMVSYAAAEPIRRRSRDKLRKRLGGVLCESTDQRGALVRSRSQRCD